MHQIVTWHVLPSVHDYYYPKGNSVRQFFEYIGSWKQVSWEWEIIQNIFIGKGRKESSGEQGLVSEAGLGEAPSCKKGSTGSRGQHKDDECLDGELLLCRMDKKKILWMEAREEKENPTVLFIYLFI